VCLAVAVAAVGAPVHLPALLIAYPAGMAAVGLSLLPGGIGVVATALVLAMVAGGIPAASALPAVVLYRSISLGAVVAAGWGVAAVQGRRIRTRSAPDAARHGPAQAPKLPGPATTVSSPAGPTDGPTDGPASGPGSSAPRTATLAVHSNRVPAAVPATPVGPATCRVVQSGVAPPAAAMIRSRPRSTSVVDCRPSSGRAAAAR
jgi:hypothetical protein